jgi:hypothetical protein
MGKVKFLYSGHLHEIMSKNVEFTGVANTIAGHPVIAVHRTYAGVNQ